MYDHTDNVCMYCPEYEKEFNRLVGCSGEYTVTDNEKTDAIHPLDINIVGPHRVDLHPLGLNTVRTHRVDLHHLGVITVGLPLVYVYTIPHRHTDSYYYTLIFMYLQHVQ